MQHVLKLLIRNTDICKTHSSENNYFFPNNGVILHIPPETATLKF